MSRRSRNPIAGALRSPHLRQKIIPSRRPDQVSPDDLDYGCVECGALVTAEGWRCAECLDRLERAD